LPAKGGVFQKHSENILKLFRVIPSQRLSKSLRIKIGT
jgi:hypothetical protein